MCYCLFPVHFRHSATSIETHLRFRQRCLLRCVSSFTYGNIQRLEQLHLRSDEFFCRPLFYTTSLPGSGLMQLFCATACFLFTSGTPLQASKLTFGSDSDACYAAFLRSLTETFRGLNSCICALTSSFFKTAVLHHFPSGGWLDAAVRRCFPSKVVTPRCTPSALSLISGAFIQVAKILELGWSWCIPWAAIKFLFTHGCFTTNIELACGSNSDVCSVTHPGSLRNFMKAPGIHHFPSRVGEQKRLIELWEVE